MKVLEILLCKKTWLLDHAPSKKRPVFNRPIYIYKHVFFAGVRVKKRHLVIQPGRSETGFDNCQKMISNMFHQRRGFVPPLGLQEIWCQPRNSGTVSYLFKSNFIYEPKFVKLFVFPYLDNFLYCLQQLTGSVITK